jgi:uncharacterized protein (DUF1697 family)
VRYGVFFRALNVGKHNRVRMDDLRALATRLGYEDVATYLQTGNMALESEDCAETVTERLEAALPSLGLKDVAAIVRSRDELRALGSTGDPFAEFAVEDHRHMAIFTRDRVAPREPVPYVVKGVTVVAIDKAAVLATIPRNAPRPLNPNAVVESHWRTRATIRWWNVVDEFRRDLLA